MRWDRDHGAEFRSGVESESRGQPNQYRRPISGTLFKEAAAMVAAVVVRRQTMAESACGLGKGYAEKIKRSG